MIVVSDAILVARPITYVPDLPVILYDDVVTVSNIAATYASSSYPVINLANPQTSSFWKSGNTGTQYITVTLDGLTFTDSMGVARHNWGSGGVAVSVEGYTVASGAWVELVSSRLLSDDTPALFKFTSALYTGLRFKLVPGSTAPQAAVVSAGPSLTLPRSVPVGHKPLKYSRSRTMLSATAMNGDFLGNIILSQALATPFSVKLLDSDWYWTYGQPFIDACRDPFFLAWQPDTDPFDVAYCWATNDPQPTISQITRQVDIDLQLGGLAL